MQQLNVLPINVSKSIEAKDDAAAFNISTSKDNFSKHIDVQLAKNKQVTDSKYDHSKEANSIRNNGKSEVPKKDENIKTAVTTAEKQAHNSDNQVQDNTDETQNLTDKESSLNDSYSNKEQNIADTGKEDDVALNNMTKDSVHQTVDDSALLMSFLSKADNTLVTSASVDNSLTDDIVTDEAELGAMSAKQKTMHETALAIESSALESNELATELSGVSKAVSLNSTMLSSNTEATEEPLNLISSSSKLNTEVFVTGKEIPESDLVTDENGKARAKEINLNQQKNASDLNVNALNNNVININAKNTEASVANESADQDAIADELYAELKAMDQLAQLTKDEKSKIKSDIQLTTTMPFTQTSEGKNASVKVDSQVMAKFRLDQSTVNAEQNAKANVEVSAEADPELAVKQDILAEQSKMVNVEANKDANTKVLPKNNLDFSLNALNSSQIQSTDRATLEAYNKIEQHTAETINPLGSTEISQSQKTNTQLHQETISIFRKDFADAVKDKVMLIVSQKLQQFDITLDPPELGNMQVRVNLQGEQASVNFVVQNQQAKEALDQSMHKLRDMLAAQGVDVGDANVEQQSQQSSNNEASDDNRQPRAINTADASDAVEHSLSASIIDSSSQAVDYYA